MAPVRPITRPVQPVRALDAGPSRDPSQSVVEGLLSAALRRWQTPKGYNDRLHAQTVGSNLQCRQKPATVRQFPYPNRIGTQS